VVEFYYVWKLTNHYNVWKDTFEPRPAPGGMPPGDNADDDVDDEDEEEEEGYEEEVPKPPAGKKAKA
jgi:hypothetical protein